MRIMKSSEVVALTRLSRTSLWRLERAGVLPKRINLSERCRGWLEEDIENFINTRSRGIGGADTPCPPKQLPPEQTHNGKEGV